MHVVIGGCGRVGARLATTLADAAHDVVVIDRHPEAFARLGDDFRGRTLPGVVFDRATLEKAGIRRAQAYVAVTSGDNSNIVSARAARDAYGVEHVVARIYDPLRAEIFERLGVTTIATARWTAEAVLRVLLPADQRVEAGIGPGDGDIALVSLRVPQGALGIEVARLNRPGRAVVAAVTRDGRTTVPAVGALVGEGDWLYVAVDRQAVDALRGELAALVEEEAG